MEKMVIKVTLNSRNPAEAALIEILKDVGNRSAYLKITAFHYHNVLGKLSQSYDPKNDVCPDVSKSSVEGELVNTGKKQSTNANKININFADTFAELK